MLKRHWVTWMSLAGMTILSAGVASGQTYPNKPIRIVTGSTGVDPDFISRLIAQHLTASWGQQVVVDNRPTLIAGEIVLKAPPDGYTLLATGWALWLRPFLQEASYDPMKDYAPIMVSARSPSVLVIHPSVPMNSVKELIAVAKAKPGELNYGTGGPGTTPHLAAELFKFMAGVNIVRINYKSGGLALNDVIAGQVQLMFASAPSVAQHVKSGRLRVLAVTSAQPSPLVPGMPTVAASGVPGYEIVSNEGLFAPAKTPAAIINRLNQEIVRMLSSPEVKERFLNVGLEAVGSSPQELGAVMKSEMTVLGKVIKAAGIRGE